MPPRKVAARPKRMPDAGLPAPETLPQVVILGRPNVGKSTLFNRVIGGREAIVHEERGVTRDRLVRTAEWLDTPFAVTDQAGWEHQSENPFSKEMSAQIDHAIAEATVIWFLVDRKTGINAEDRLLADKVRPLLQKKPIILVVNKVDDPVHEHELGEFYALGLGDPHPISSAHGRGIGDLLDATLPFLIEELEAPIEEVEEEFETIAEEDESAPKEITFAILGRQNVGKSSLFNQLVGNERSIVSKIAGTTRDAIDAAFEWGGHAFRSVDTAGLKRRTRIDGDIDFYAMRRAEQAMLRAEVAVLVLDVSMGITDTDQKIAGLIHDGYRACVIVANKWDLSVGKDEHKEAFLGHVRAELHYLFWAPVVYTSALNGEGTDDLVQAITDAHRAFHHRVNTGELNAIVDAIWEHNPPQSWKGRRGKIYYATQVGVAPPHIVLQVNRANLFIDSYIRYMYKALHSQLPLVGSPIKISFRGKPKKEGAR